MHAIARVSPGPPLLMFVEPHIDLEHNGALEAPPVIDPARAVASASSPRRQFSPKSECPAWTSTATAASGNEAAGNAALVSSASTFDVIFAPHWYDAVTLLTKSFRHWLTLDVLNERPTVGHGNVIRCFARNLAHNQRLSAGLFSRDDDWMADGGDGGGSGGGGGGGGGEGGGGRGGSGSGGSGVGGVGGVGSLITGVGGGGLSLGLGAGGGGGGGGGTGAGRRTRDRAGSAAAPLLAEHIPRRTPTLVGEVGLPFDLADKKAFETGDFSLQCSAYDSIMQALDRTLSSYTLWNYTPDNTNARGDQWNDEDLSLFSRDQQHCSSEDDDQQDPDAARDLNSGGRALGAVVRPYAHRVAGVPLEMRFDAWATRRPWYFRFKSCSLLPERGLDEDDDEIGGGEVVRVRVVDDGDGPVGGGESKEARSGDGCGEEGERIVLPAGPEGSSSASVGGSVVAARRAAAGLPAPTVIFVPQYQYPRGVHVAVSDGTYELDLANQSLFYFHAGPPGSVHWIRLTSK